MCDASMYISKVNNESSTLLEITFTALTDISMSALAGIICSEISHTTIARRNSDWKDVKVAGAFISHVQ